MPISAQNLLSLNPRSHLCFLSPPPHILPDSLKPPMFSIKNTSHFHILRYQKPSNRELEWRLGAYESSNTTVERENLDWDVVLSIAELVCLVPSAVVSIGCVVNWTFVNSQKLILNKVVVGQLGLLVGAVIIGGFIRRRQLGRLYGVPLKSGVSKVDLVGRIEKLEEDLRCSTTIIRVLSRQLEKLGIRFRVTRKSLKEPISETAALALKNSEATQALQMQKDILEKELGEIQKVLLAMQEQQHKQLELILAVAKSGKLRESKRESLVESTTQHINSVPVHKEENGMENQTKTGGRQKIANNDSA